MSIGAVLLALAAKFKTALLLLLQFKWALVFGKLLVSGGSLLLSIASWALFWGWKFATGFVVLIFIHEMGHYLLMKAKGYNPGLPVFVPFIGAYVAMRGRARDVKEQAEIALAGPLLGSLGAGACYLVGLRTGSSFWFALASIGFFINLLNLIPVLPFDGGYIAATLSPKLWIAGIAAVALLAVLHPGTWLLFIGVIILMSVPQMLASFRMQALDAPYFSVPLFERVAVGVQYFGLAATLAVMWVTANGAVRIAPVN